MSEPIGMNITIGGNLPKALVGEFLDTVFDDIGNIEQGPTSGKEFQTEVGKGPVKWAGVTNWGQCESLKAFCENHNLPYIHHTDAKDCYDADIHYWVPGMKCEKISKTDTSGDVVIDANIIRPICDLMIALIENPNALPTFVGVDNEDLLEIVEKGLKRPKSLIPALKKKLNEFLPVPPTLPSLNII